MGGVAWLCIELWSGQCADSRRPSLRWPPQRSKASRQGPALELPCEKVLSPLHPRPLLLGDVPMSHPRSSGDGALVVAWTVRSTPDSVLWIQCHHDTLQI